MWRLVRGGLWLVAPTYAAWQVGKATVSHPLEPFERWNWKKLRLEILALIGGAVALVLAVKYGIPIVGIFGVGWTVAALFKLAARTVIPKRWAKSEMDFVAMTSLGMVTRIGLWIAFITSLALAQWPAAFGFGLAAALLALNGVVALALARRMNARRQSYGSQPQ